MGQGQLRGSLRCAVITGDIIDSSKLSTKNWERLHAALAESSGELRALFERDMPLNVDLFRGDSWQALVLDPAKALRLSLLFRTLLRAKMDIPSLDTRMAIGVGRIDLLPKSRVSQGHGEAFTLSGGALDELHEARWGNMCFTSADKEQSDKLDVIVRLIDAIASRWTTKQALAVSGALQGMRQEEIGAKVWRKKISQQAVAQHLKRADWYAVERGVLFFEDQLGQSGAPVKAENKHDRL